MKKISPKTKKIAPVLTILIFIITTSFGETHTWTGNAGGVSWGRVGNWNTNPAFNTTTDLVLPQDLNDKIYLQIDQDRTIRSLTVGANVGTAGNNYATFDIRTNTNQLIFEADAGNASINVAQSTSGAVQMRLGKGDTDTVVLNSNLDLRQNNTYYTTTKGFTMNGKLSGAGTINKSGAGLVRLIRNNSAWTGGLTIQEGTVEGFFDANAFGTGAVTLAGDDKNTVLQLDDGLTFKNNIKVEDGAGDRTIQFIPGQTGTVSLRDGAVDLSAGKDLTFNSQDASSDFSVAYSVSGTGGLIKTGAGRVKLWNKDNDFSGGTDVQEGTLEINGGGVAGVGEIKLSAGTTLEFGSTSSRTATNVISGAGRLVVNGGTGTTTLSGTNTYTGVTSINTGTLIVNGDHSAATGAVTVNVGASLGGSGIFGGAVTVHGNLNPGNSPGKLTFNESLQLTATSVTNFEITGTGTGAFDVLANDGGDTINFTDGATLNFDFDGYSGVLGDSFLVLENWNSIVGNIENLNLNTLNLIGFAVDASQLLQTGRLSVIVPEPTTLAMILVFMPAIIFPIVRRHRK